MSETPSRTYLQLVRFPLVFTVWSDVLMGYFLGAAYTGELTASARMAALLTVTTLLYAGGMALVDCFGYLSETEHGRPRPMPVGLMSLHGTLAVALMLVLAAVGGATAISARAGLVCAAVALLLLCFASLTRGLPFLGTTNISLVRSATVVMGMAFARDAGPLVPALEHWGPIAGLFGYMFVVLQMGAETEPHKRERLLRLTATVIVLLVVFNVLLYVKSISSAKLTDCLFLSVFVIGVILRLVQLARRALIEGSAEAVEKLMVAGLVGAIVLNANFVAFAGRLVPTLGMLFLLVPTTAMLRFFHVLYPGTRTAMD